MARCLADPDGVSELRFLVDRKDIKCITVEPGVIPPDDISFEPALKCGLPISYRVTRTKAMSQRTRSLGMLSSPRLSDVISRGSRTYSITRKSIIFNSDRSTVWTKHPHRHLPSL
ncbi:hypothetical protein F5B21DRAFT_483061 [Xylaria acuta]|nr:hypothetical protein F5B21DRAFT_483061 [Xylaria acuta]